MGRRTKIRTFFDPPSLFFFFMTDAIGRIDMGSSVYSTSHFSFLEPEPPPTRETTDGFLLHPSPLTLTPFNVPLSAVFELDYSACLSDPRVLPPGFLTIIRFPLPVVRADDPRHLSCANVSKPTRFPTSLRRSPCPLSSRFRNLR